MMEKARIRRSVIAGSWYPGTAQALRATLERFLSNVEPQPLPGELMALIAPHAGYIYSGQIAAYAYKQLEHNVFERVVVISPVHRMFVGRFAITSADYYETPLGLAAVDAEFVEALSQEIPIQRVTRDNEHSLEIQIPFLQYMLGDFKLTPIMMGDQDWETCVLLSQALAKIVNGKKVLLVASSDLSHFHGYRTAVRLDSIVQDYVKSFDPQGLSRALAARQCEACGGGPIVATMLTSKALGADGASVLKYANSGDVTGDHSSVVGYLAAAIYKGE